jgi:3-oxoacyl-[acyl-carrier-protein] synthase II
MSEVAITGAAAVLEDALEDRLDALPDAARSRALRAERVTQLALAASGGALAEAGLLAVEGLPRADFGITLGTAFGCFLTNAAYQRRLAASGTRAASPRLFAATVSNAAAGEVGIGYRLGGPAVTLTAGAAAGLLAIGHAADAISSARARVILAGGVDATGPALARWLANGGLAVGETPVCGAAAIAVLQSTAAADGPGYVVPGKVRGYVLGYGAGFTPPGENDGGGVLAAVSQALDHARVRPAQLARVVLEGGASAADSAQGALRAVLGGAVPAAARPSHDHVERFAAGGPIALLAALRDATPESPFLVLHACSSGHVAAMIAMRTGPA